MLAYTLMNLLKSPGRTFQVFIGTLLVLLLLFAAAAFQSGMDESLTVSGDEQNIILLGAGSEESLERSEVSWNAVSAAKGIRGLEQQFGQPLVGDRDYLIVGRLYKSGKGEHANFDRLEMWVDPVPKHGEEADLTLLAETKLGMIGYLPVILHPT